MEDNPYGLHCPNCGRKYECPCETCTKLRGNVSGWKVINGEQEQCACGFTATLDWWEELEMQIWEVMKNQKTASETLKQKEER